MFARFKSAIFGACAVVFLLFSSSGSVFLWSSCWFHCFSIHILEYIEPGHMVANHWARTRAIDKDGENHTKILYLPFFFLFLLSLALLLVMLLLWMFKVKADCFWSVFMLCDAEGVGRIECVCGQAHFSPVHLLLSGLPFKVSGPHNGSDTNAGTQRVNWHRQFQHPSRCIYWLYTREVLPLESYLYALESRKANNGHICTAKKSVWGMI